MQEKCRDVQHRDVWTEFQSLLLQSLSGYCIGGGKGRIMGKRYLIVKLAAIGDVIMAIPMVYRIREVDFDADITWLCGKSVYPILKAFPIDHLICIDEKKLLAGNKIQKVQAVLSAWRQIAFRHYDVVALGHASRRYRLLTFLTKSAAFYAFSHISGKIWPIPGRHHTDEYVRLVRSDLKEITPPAQFPAVELPQGIRDIFAKEKKIVVLAPGGAKNVLADDGVRRWPIESYVALARQLMDDGMQVIVTGASSDQWVLKYFADLNIVDLVGKTNLIQLIGVFQHADVVVTHDSGPLHLAGMTQTFLIALFGPTNPWEKVPQRRNVVALWQREKYNCCPCYDGKYYAKCTMNRCLISISYNQVYRLINNHIEFESKEIK